MNQGVPVVIEFKAQNQFVMLMDRGDVIGTLAGTYYVEGNKLGITIETISGKGVTLKAPPSVRDGKATEYEVTDTQLRWRDNEEWRVLTKVKDWPLNFRR